MSPLLPATKKQSDSQILLVDEGKLITDPSNFLNNHHTIPVIGQITEVPEKHFEDHSSVLEIKKRSINVGFSFKPVTIHYVYKLLNTINVNKSSGCDGISPRLLKLSTKGRAEPLTKLFNYYISNSRWPSKWKLSNVIPAFKKNRTTNKNYQPTTHLQIFRKSKV